MKLTTLSKILLNAKILLAVRDIFGCIYLGRLLKAERGKGQTEAHKKVCGYLNKANLSEVL